MFWILSWKLCRTIMNQTKEELFISIVWNAFYGLEIIQKSHIKSFSVSQIFQFRGNFSKFFFHRNLAQTIVEKIRQIGRAVLKWWTFIYVTADFYLYRPRYQYNEDRFQLTIKTSFEPQTGNRNYHHTQLTFQLQPSSVLNITKSESGCECCGQI